MCSAPRPTIYLHHYGFLLPVAQTAFVIIWLAATRDWRSFLVWVAAGVAVILLYLPWVPRSGHFWIPRLAPGPGSCWPCPGAIWRHTPSATRCRHPGTTGCPGCTWHWPCLACGPGGVRTAWPLLLLCVTALPFAGAIGLAIRQPDYHERYTIFISAPLVLLVARGLWPISAGSHKTAERHALARCSP